MKFLSILILLLFVFFSGLISAQPLNNIKVDGYRGIWFELNQKHPFGDKYSGGLGTYTADHFPLAIHAEQVNKTFFVYGGTIEKESRHLLCMIGCYDHAANLLEKPTVVYDKDGVDDPHDNPSLLIDKNGYIWVFVSGRGRARSGFKYKSKEPYSIDEFTQIRREEMTYPQPWQMDQGMIHLFTKYTGLRELYFETSTDGYTWTEDQKLSGIREAGDEMGGHYQVSQKYENTLGTFFNRHPNGNVDKRTDIYYLQTTDLGKTWTNAAGEKLDIPLTEVENSARVCNYSEEEKNVYICDMNYDAYGNPVCLYIESNGHVPGPISAPYIWHVTKWTGKEWKTLTIGLSDHNYDMGSLFVSDSTWLVVAPLINGPQLWGAGGELVFYHSEDSGDTWERGKQITCNSERNNSYVRRPQNAQDPFLYFWADGDARQFSISKLYFGDSKGNVWQMPYEFDTEKETPILQFNKFK